MVKIIDTLHIILVYSLSRYLDWLYSGCIPGYRLYLVCSPEYIYTWFIPYWIYCNGVLIYKYCNMDFENLQYEYQKTAIAISNSLI